MMPVGIIGGTGSEGRGIALRLASAGVPVVIGSRALARARAVVDTLRPRTALIGPADNAAAIEGCDITVLAVPFTHAREILQIHEHRFRPGSLVIDVTIPVVFENRVPRLLDVPEGSAAEQVRRYLPANVRVAAALKTIPARVLGDMSVPLDCDDFVCGDSDEARARAVGLLQQVHGLRVLDVGSLEAARLLERMTMLAIQINRRYGIHDARFRLVGLPPLR